MVSDHPMLINGELTQASSGLSDPVVNPATGEAFDFVPHGSREDLDAAVAAAKAAFPGWRDMSFEQRAACLLKFGELVEANAEELAKALTMEQGKPLAMAMGEVKGVLSKCKECIKHGDIKMETVSEDESAQYTLINRY